MKITIANIQHDITNNIGNDKFSHHNFVSPKIVTSDGKLAVTIYHR